MKRAIKRKIRLLKAKAHRAAARGHGAAAYAAKLKAEVLSALAKGGAQ